MSPLLGIYYSWMVVLSRLCGFLRNVEMALHAYPGCTMTQDISVAEVKLHFSICLSRVFTTQIGGYISSDWSYMLFTKRYGTKASIRVEPLALHHIEPYTLNLINMNCTILEMDENDIVNDLSTSLAEIPDFLLDEWDNGCQLDPILETLEIGLSTYCISEKDALVPNLMKTKDEMSGIWSMYFDGSRDKNGSAAGVMLISPTLERYYFSFTLQFNCTNNVAEYESLIQGLLLAQKRGIQALSVYGDSELVVNQVRN